MASIHLLDPETINKIAAGEVVERPMNVVKELVENAMDAGATAITVEIKNGGIDLIRVTDNGCGIPAGEITRAFRRHATSKIEDSDDLQRLVTLGFRGEALSSIAAVSRIEMVTKTRDALVGIRAVNDVIALQNGAADEAASAPADVIPLDLTEIGAPDGTSVIVRDLFYNVPVRRKFLKSAQTEAGYVTDIVEHMALSHPNISFHYRVNNQEKLHTTGNGDEKELIYRIYGRDMSKSVIPIDVAGDTLRIRGYLGRPEFSRGSRSYELFFVNGRMLRSDVLSKALEEGYRTDLMQHRFPFAVLHLTVPTDEVDVNVHPAKMEVRFSHPKDVYDFINESVHGVLHKVELIPQATLNTRREEQQLQKDEQKAREEEIRQTPHIEAFEADRKAPAATAFRESDALFAAAAANDSERNRESYETEEFTFEDRRPKVPQETAAAAESTEAPRGEYRQQTFLSQETNALDENRKAPKEDLAENHIMVPENVTSLRIVGQVFDTYWIVEYKDQMLMIDQHAAHEKVNFERLMARLEKEQNTPAPSQMLAPPIVVNLTGREEGALRQYIDTFTRMGYELEPFGDNSWAIRAVPMELYANEPDALLQEILDEILAERMSGTPAAILYKIASMSCKAAVKGNMRLSQGEIEALIRELLSLDNPYHCPHGRPTMIVMSENEIEKKFKRIV